jgi:RiboL-PSP-HEPN
VAARLAPTVDTVANSQASQIYDSLIQDVQNLITLHPSTEGTRGRPAGDTGPLLRSAVVLLHTAWENYVERVAVEGLEFLLGQIGSDHTKLHHALEQKLAALKNPWALAGMGWQAEARNAVGQQVGRLNTPNVVNTEELLDLAIGLPDALHDVSWPKMGETKVLANVDEFVHDIRGEIVHRGTAPGPLHKGGVNSWINFFDGLVTRLDKKIGTHLETKTGTAPW